MRVAVVAAFVFFLTGPFGESAFAAFDLQYHQPGPTPELKHQLIKLLSQDREERGNAINTLAALKSDDDFVDSVRWLFLTSQLGIFKVQGETGLGWNLGYHYVAITPEPPDFFKDFDLSDDTQKIQGQVKFTRKAASMALLYLGIRGIEALTTIYSNSGDDRIINFMNYLLAYQGYAQKTPEAVELVHEHIFRFLSSAYAYKADRLSAKREKKRPSPFRVPHQPARRQGRSRSA